MTAAPALVARRFAQQAGSSFVLGRSVAGVLSLAAAAGGVLLSLHHPLSPSAVLAAALAAALLVAWRPAAWLLLVPALLPLIGLAPWSGWLVVEELDILVLSVAAGGYFRLALGNHGKPGNAASPSPLVVAALLLLAASVALSAWRGFTASGTPTIGWFQGYREPMNALRLGKSFFLAALLLPLWLAANRTLRNAGDRLAWGLVLGLASAVLAALSERLAYTGLLDFSSDYRTTALFWEMHVGGAALDGFLALSMPFMVHLLWHARSRLQWGVAAALVAPAGYVCVTTFSRAVYVALPASLVLMFALHVRAARGMRRTEPATTPVPRLHTGLLVTGFAVAAAWLFHGSGYRGMLALLGATLLLLPLAETMRSRSVADWFVGGACGLALAAVMTLLADALPKGAYVVCGAVWCATVVLLARARRARGRARGWVRAALASGLASVCCVGLVARHWGGATALADALPVLVLWLLALLLLSRGAAARPADARWHVSLAMMLFVAAMFVAAFSGGAYIGGRFADGSRDLAMRAAHWKRSLDTLRTPSERAFGHGLGSFPLRYFLSSAADEQAGDWRVLREGGESYVALGGSKHLADFHEHLRVSQRIAAPRGPLSLRFDARAPAPATMHFEVCQKHLLYPANCLFGGAEVPAGTAWTPVRTTLSGGSGVDHGSWYAPRLIVFSMVVATRGGRVEIDNLRLVDADGRDMLANGDFSADAAHWFFSSDRVHMPWHMKGLLPHQLYEQGLVGALLLAALLAAALWRLVAGSARGHALAPALAGALAGFVLVGVSDSLLDAPRIAFLFYLLLMVALTLPRQLAREMSVVADGAGRATDAKAS